MKLLCVTGLVLLAGCASVHTKIEIHAPAKNVRTVLFKFNEYPKWNPFIIKVEGVVAEGNKVAVTVKPVGKAELSGHAKVALFQKNHLTWNGSLPIPGLFHGKHEFIIQELDANRTMFYQNEDMSGLVIPLLDRKPTEAGFIEMNKALKKQAEKAVN